MKLVKLVKQLVKLVIERMRAVVWPRGLRLRALSKVSKVPV
jgi:hypothetical protein